MSNTTSAASAWLVAGLRTPFAKVDGKLSEADAIELSLPVVRSMLSPIGASVRPDLAVWGTVAPNLGYSNLAREVLIDAGLDQTIPAFSTVMACGIQPLGCRGGPKRIRRQAKDRPNNYCRNAPVV